MFRMKSVENEIKFIYSSLNYIHLIKNKRHQSRSSLSIVLVNYNLIFRNTHICLEQLSSKLKKLVSASFSIYSATFWLKYGILKEDSVIMIVNSTGMVLGMMYLAVYYYFCTNRVNT